MSKKIVILLLVVVAIIVVAGFGLYQNGRQVPVNSENQENIPVGEVEVNGGGQGGLVICSDKCGDGICQELEEKCSNLNCICREDKQECPQDCK